MNTQWQAQYWYYGTLYTDGFDSLEEALQYLSDGECNGSLSSHAVFGPDGEVAISRDSGKDGEDEIFNAVYGYGDDWTGAARATTIEKVTAKHTRETV